MNEKKKNCFQKVNDCSHFFSQAVKNQIYWTNDFIEQKISLNERSFNNKRNEGKWTMTQLTNEFKILLNDCKIWTKCVVNDVRLTNNYWKKPNSPISL